jgi:alpha-tubulin suppressor-like RCC1 family protein
LGQQVLPRLFALAQRPGKLAVGVSGKYLSDVVALSAGDAHSVAVKGDGTVWSWGSNGNGRLGDGTNIQRTVPVQSAKLVGGGVVSGITEVSAGATHTLTVRAGDGSVWAWGYNANGSLDVIGVTGGHSAPAPVQVPLPPGPPIVDIDMDNACHATILRADGTLLGWGCDFFGQVGDGADSNTSVTTPTVIPIPGRRVVAGRWNRLI